MLFCNVCKSNRFLEYSLFTFQNNLSFRNGATWSGYFVALCNSIDKMLTEQNVDIFKVVRLIRSTRPEFIDQVGFFFLYLL